MNNRKNWHKFCNDLCPVKQKKKKLKVKLTAREKRIAIVAFNIGLHSACGMRDEIPTKRFLFSLCAKSAMKSERAKREEAEKKYQDHRDATLDGDCQICDYEAYNSKIKELEAKLATANTKIVELEVELFKSNQRIPAIVNDNHLREVHLEMALSTANKKAEKLVEALEKLKIKEHEECEDSFYSCPKHQSCSNYQYDDLPTEERPCFCGKEENNKFIEQALKEFRGEK